MFDLESSEEACRRTYGQPLSPGVLRWQRHGNSRLQV